MELLEHKYKNERANGDSAVSKTADELNLLNFKNVDF